MGAAFFGADGRSALVTATATATAAIPPVSLPAPSSMAPPPPPPPPPANLTATSTDDSVTLSWDDPSDPSITGYRILYRAPAHARPAFAVLVADTGTASTTYGKRTRARHRYEFAVVALSGTGPPSAASQPVGIHTTGAPPPPPIPLPPAAGQKVCR